MLTILSVILICATILSALMTILAHKDKEAAFIVFLIGTAMLFMGTEVCLFLCRTTWAGIAMPVLALLMCGMALSLKTPRTDKLAGVFLIITMIIALLSAQTVFGWAEKQGPTEIMMAKYHIKGQIMPNNGLLYFEDWNGDTVLFAVHNGKAYFIEKTQHFKTK